MKIWNQTKNQKQQIIDTEIATPIAKSETLVVMPKVQKVWKNKSSKGKYRGRSKKKITACPHIDKDHYAKGMCNTCYHTLGRQTLATACPHLDLKSYAKGLCKSCYFKRYNNRNNAVK